METLRTSWICNDCCGTGCGSCRGTGERVEYVDVIRCACGEPSRDGECHPCQVAREWAPRGQRIEVWDPDAGFVQARVVGIRDGETEWSTRWGRDWDDVCAIRRAEGGGVKTIIINGLRLHADVGESYFRSDYGDLVTTIHAYVDRDETRVSITVMKGRLSITSRAALTDADLAFVSALTDLIQASSPAIAEALAHAVIRMQLADGQIAQVAT